jgi:hypothetical protein
VASDANRLPRSASSVAIAVSAPAMSGKGPGSTAPESSMRSMMFVDEREEFGAQFGFNHRRALYAIS